MIYLHELLREVTPVQVTGSTDIPVSGVAYDSRKVQPGSLFVAIKGYHVDGHDYVPQAIAQGAAAIVVDARYAGGSTLAADTPAVPVISVPNSRAVLAPIAAAYYRYPAHQLGVVGVTGTKGKTTTTTLVSHVLEQAGYAIGMITTVDFKIGPREWANTMRQSTPEALEIQAFLREVVDAGCDYAVLEASSHGLSEGWNRLGNCAFDVAVCTNVTHEHLDYHGSVEQYRRDKARLFALLGAESSAIAGGGAGGAGGAALREPVAIVNADDPSHRLFLNAAPAHARRLTFAIDASADIRASGIGAAASETRMQVATPWGEGEVLLPLPGRFNVYNALAAIAVGLSQGVPFPAVCAALGCVRSVRGRMEQIAQGQPFNVLVDYAHNPDSFEQVMGMMRPLTARRMIAVFGSAGERDIEKRAQQGAIAARYCDLLILTDEDPRGEDPATIIADIARGAEEAGKQANQGYLCIPDRTAAIRAAFANAQDGDLVLLLGKGHEGSIEYADGKHPWDEAAQARVALAEMGWGGEGDAPRM
jgi:UDP-N-acetylmuramoyl-L-alanyl-D-glutamate--2,6-diaminopimelate ligase